MGIQSLPTITSSSQLSQADMVALFSSALGCDAKVSMSLVAGFLQTLFTTSGSQTQYAAPSATGFSVLIAPIQPGGNVDLLLTPTAGYAAGTITLPASPVDHQRVNVVSTQAVTALTVAGNGATVTGAPTTLAANGFFTLRYDAVLGGWYRTN